MYKKKIPPEPVCPFEYAMSLFSGKWNIRVLCLLAHNESMRFGDFKEILSDISDTALSLVLKKYTENQVVIRKAFDEIPPRVEYMLSEKGKKVVPVLQQLCSWSVQYGNPVVTDFEECENCKYGIEKKVQTIPL